ncbi:hypothetical protein CWE12_07960 [Aliidiomarina sedimenti]|uniref:Flagellar hook-associated protein 2 n=1 Tax=Aliidiomarina sedimenti TaxID=1933879 RepID=A0ABY0BYX9_9GAMM|nr:flagellar filament capping protein FliD [Aliidiomarina sedimenti]RUO29896.1 hypothetical protein CWE12_07960 [Aliidiomarina sedimenti]
MAMTSLGVGSGIDLDGMVRQLVQLERQGKESRLVERTRDAESNISAVGKLKSSMTELVDALDSLSRERDLNARSATIAGQDEDNPFFTANANQRAATSNYNIQINQVASGSRMQSASFANSTDPQATGAGSLTFSAGGDNTFDVDVEDGASLSDIADAINRSDSNFGVTASVINTGTESFLVFDSTVTGDGNDLSITANGVGGLDGLTDANLTERKAAQGAIMTVDGIEVRSDSNTFDNAIEGVSITAERETGVDDEPKLTVEVDEESVRGMVDDFVSAYNGLVDEIAKLTEYVPEGKSGPLIGDSMVRSIRSRMASIISTPIEGGGDFNSLYQMGIVTDNDGKIEFDPRNIGGGTGTQRFDQSLAQNFDGMVELLSGENGIATQLRDVTREYTQSQGLLDGRTNVYESQKQMVDNEREQFERYMEQYESNLRQRFGSLDQNIARMSSSLNFLTQWGGGG